VSELIKEMTKEVTAEILSKAAPGKRLPMKKHEGRELRVACVHKGDDGKFHLHLNENIWGVAHRPPVVEVVYKNLDDLIGSGWEID
jgi:hypothetical protein